MVHLVEEAEESIDAVLSEVGGFKHTLHLYSSDVDKYAIQSPFLVNAGGERTIYVTLDDPARVKEEMGELGAELSVVRPEKLGEVSREGEDLKIIVDAASIDTSETRGWRRKKRKKFKKFFDPQDRERFLSENFGDARVLCTYNLGALNPDLVRELVEGHDKLMLTRSDATILASESLNRADVTSESIQRSIKDELETVVLAFLLREPMCGTDIIETIHERFGILLSPGTIYPLLHDLEERGLLTREHEAKTKTYSPKESAEGEIRDILDEHVKVSRFLSRFLETAGLKGEIKEAGST